MAETGPPDGVNEWRRSRGTTNEFSGLTGVAFRPPMRF